MTADIIPLKQRILIPENAISKNEDIDLRVCPTGHDRGWSVWYYNGGSAGFTLENASRANALLHAFDIVERKNCEMRVQNQPFYFTRQEYEAELRRRAELCREALNDEC